MNIYFCSGSVRISITPGKAFFFFFFFFLQPKFVDIFLFFHNNICCWYSLEVPTEGLLMSTNRICFY